MALNPCTLRHAKSWSIYLALVFCLPFIAKAQPAGLPWQLDPSCQSIITTGIAAMTCGTTTEVPINERYTFGMMDVNGVLPATGRVDVSSQTEVYHHPSWLIDSIGNVFGITMDRCGNTYVAASSNYSSYFFISESVIRYGDIGGGAESVQAAGTVYKIDGMSGQANVFAVLPQQASDFENVTCEGISNISRNTGPGLGNLVFSHLTKQFYVTNFEDGRIYRLDENGNILDSYDPYLYDTGAPGVPTDMDDIPYGIDINANATKLYFGTCGFTEQVPGPKPKIYSIPLNLDGSFVGNLNNTSLPAGATWNNYTGNETLQYELGTTTAIFENLYFSDLEITPNGDMLVGGRVGCQGSVHTSYNHGGMAFLLSQNAGIYSNVVGVIYTGYPSSIGGSSEAYGGVSAFSSPTGPPIQFLNSSADMLLEEGPHGICILPQNTFGASGNPASPAGIISYGTVNNNGVDPKGVGGDVKMFVACECQVACQTEITATANDTVLCSGSTLNLGYTATGGNSPLTVTWTDQNGDTLNPNNLVLTNTECAPATFTYTVTAICEEDPSMILTDAINITVWPTDISQFVTTVEAACEISVTIDPACTEYMMLVGNLPPINPGDSGSVTVNVVTNDSLHCASETYNLSYNCPACVINNLTAEAQECDDTLFLVQLNMDVALGSDSFMVNDQNGNQLGTFGYADLPVQVGPLYGDSVTVYTLTVQDLENPGCQNTVDVGPQDCLPKCGFFEMPNAFSPNGDGKNDTYYPVSLWEFEVMEFKIYNRWGELVHDSVEPWDGDYHGKAHNSDVFIYIITVDTFCGIEKQHGDVTLLR